MVGRIHSFQSLGAVDGPGLRFVVFMQGCNARCSYCHNPDTWDVHGGTPTTPQQVYERLIRCRPYFGEDGGVTVSGGEPLLQAQFVFELFSLCKRERIHTCLDTSGCRLDASVLRLLSVTDLCLLDIKATDTEAYLALSGMDLKTPLAFLGELEKQNIPTWVRHVVVPGLNDTEQNIEKLNALVAPYHCIQKVELLAFHTMCVEKYKSLGIPFPLENTPPMDDARLARFSRLLAPPHGSKNMLY